ncbi:MAG: SHOCT domain-containing protein [Thermomicrobiales bacterium]
MSLLKTAAKVGVATSVHGRVQRRQHEKWTAQDAAAAAAAPAQQFVAVPVAPEPAPAPVAVAPAVDFDTKLAQLKQLGELRDAGILTEPEFEIKKAEILRQ